MDKKVVWDKKATTELSIEIPEQEINDVKLAEQQNLDLRRTIRLYFREYCLNSSLHGIRYLGEKGRTKTERVLWFLFFITSIFLCSQLIKKTWMKWDSMPVIIGFTETPTPVWQIPFPAVTICSETKVCQSKFNYTAYTYMKKNQINITEEDEKYFSAVSLVCDNFSYAVKENTIDPSTIDLIHDVAPESDEFLWVCLWLNINTTETLNISCENVFSKSLTEEGICYTFNMLDNKDLFNEEAQNEYYFNYNIPSKWSLDKGYEKGSNMNVYPKRTFASGKNGRLSLLLQNYEEDFDYMCGPATPGFKIIFHSPDEIPRVGHQYVKVSSNQDVLIAIQPDIMITSKELIDYDPSRRKCYFPHEMKLRYFKIYSQKNCEIECLTNYTLSKCECVAFHMPRAKDTPVCGSARSQCVNLANYEFDIRDLASDESLIDPEDKYKTTPNCNCLPGCSSLAYNAEITSEEFHLKKQFEVVKVNTAVYQGVQISRVHIYFKDNKFMTRRRSELYNQTDFLANCGGLLGLFIGFSFLSLVEIAYFITLRFFCNIEMHIKRLWNAIKIDPLRG